MSSLQLGLVFVIAAMLAGVVQGAVHGLGFASADYLGGYASWRRRLLRLGHISWFGIAFLHVTRLLGVQAVTGGTPRWLPYLGGLANVSMPAVCALSAWRVAWRHAFIVPVPSAAALLLFSLWEICTCASAS